MTEQENDNLGLRIWGWLSPEPGLVVGYVEDADGELHLYAVMKYPPITGASLRAIRLRELDDPEQLSGPRWPPGPPPNPMEVAAAWAEGPDGVAVRDMADALGLNDDEVAQVRARILEGHSVRLTVLREAGYGNFLGPSYLVRQPGESPAAFYSKVADVYLVLTDMGVEDPARHMAQIVEGTDTPSAKTRSTVRSWIHRARHRHLLPAPQPEAHDE